MTKNIFLNLPVGDIARSRAFFGALGFTFNEQFSSEDTTCLVLGDNIYCMLLLPERFKSFSLRPLGDAQKETNMLICIDAESREAVDAMVQAAINNGGSPAAPPQDHGWMYGHSFYDPDGHHWEVAYMDISAFTG